MTAPEFSRPAMRQVDENMKEYFTVQHKLPGVEGWHQESPPMTTAEEAVAAFEAHAHWYRPGHIRAVRKVVRTTVEIDTTELRTLTAAQITTQP